jgi:hypothetical protein
MRKIFTALLMCLTATLLICNAKAQPAPPAAVQRAEVVQKLPDGDYVVRIEGVEYRAVSASHERQLLEGQNEPDRFSKERALLDLKSQRLSSLIRPPGGVSTIYDNPFVQAGAKFVMPASHTMLTARRE